MKRMILNLLLILIPTAPALSATLLVQPDGTGDYPTIQAAIDAAAPRDTIVLADGVYSGPGNRELYLEDIRLEIMSMHGDPEACILDCEGERLGDAYMGELDFRGIGFTHCDYLYAYMIVPTYCDCRFSDCIAVDRGMDDAGAAFVNCLFLNCTGRIMQNGSAYRSEFRDNTGGIAAGAYNHFIECDFFGNSSGGEPLISITEHMGMSGQHLYQTCNFVGNGPGVVIDSGRGGLDMLNSTFRGNAGVCIAGEIWEAEEGREININGSTFTMNVGDGPDLRFVNATPAYSTVHVNMLYDIFHGRDGGVVIETSGEGVEVSLRTCDVFGNSGGDWVGVIADQEHLYNNFSADPEFCDSIDYDPYIFDSSPCAPANAPGGVLIGAWPVDCTHATSIAEAAPPALELLGNRPNPFNPQTEIIFALPVTARVSLAIFDATGRHVRTLLDDVLRPAGEQGVVWDGRADNGLELPSGVYFSRLETRDLALSAKMILLR